MSTSNKFRYGELEANRRRQENGKAQQQNTKKKGTIDTLLGNMTKKYTEIQESAENPNRKNAEKPDRAAELLKIGNKKNLKTPTDLKGPSVSASAVNAASRAGKAQDSSKKNDDAQADYSAKGKNAEKQTAAAKIYNDAMRNTGNGKAAESRKRLDTLLYGNKGAAGIASYDDALKNGVRGKNNSKTSSLKGMPSFFDMYNQAEGNVKGSVAKTALKLENAQRYNNANWDKEWSNLPEERDYWTNQLETAKEKTKPQIKNKKLQDELFAGMKSSAIRNSRIVPKITHTSEDDIDYSEDMDETLYDQYFGVGEYKRIKQYGTYEEKVRLGEELRDIWEDIDSGRVEELDKAVRGLYQNESAYDQADSEVRYAEEQLKGIARKEEAQADYNDLLWKYSDVTQDPNYVPEYDKGGFTYGMAEIESGVQTSDINRIYSFLGQGKDYQEWAKWSEINGDLRVSSEYNYAMMMTDGSDGSNDEIGTFMKLYNMAAEEGREPEEAKAFYDALAPYLRQRYEQFEAIAVSEAANKMPVLSSIASLGMDVADAYVDVARHVAHVFGDKSTEDRNSAWFAGSRQSELIKNAVSEKIGGFGGKIYQNVMNTASNLVRGLTTPGSTKLAKEILGLGQFFLQVDQQATARYLKDHNYDEAQKLAAVDAVFEVVEEFLPYETMLGSMGKNVGLALLENGLSELGQEFTGATIFEKIKGVITGEDSEQARADEIFNNGFYVNSNGEKVELDADRNIALQQARAQAGKEMWNEAVENGLGGFFGGSVGGFYGTIAEKAGIAKYENRLNKEIGKKAINADISEKAERGARLGKQGVNELTIIHAAKEMAEGTESRKIAEEIQKGIDEHKGVKEKDIGRLVRALLNETTEDIQGTVKGMLQNVLEQRLTQMGEKEENIKPFAESLVNYISNNTNAADVTRYFFSKNMKKLLAEYKMSDGGLSKIREQIETKNEKAESIRENVKALVAEPEVSTESVQHTIEGAEAASKEEYEAAAQATREAGGEVTGDAMEVVTDGRIKKIADVVMKTVTETDEKGKEKKVKRLQVVFDDGSSTDVSNVKARNLGVAQVLQFAQRNGNTTTSDAFTKALLENVTKTQDVAALISGGMRIRWDVVTGQKTIKSGLSNEIAGKLREAAEKDLQAWDAKRLENYKEIKQGQGETTFNGVAYSKGTKAFTDALKQAGIGKAARTEAQMIGSIAQAMGFDVNLIYDTKDTANQGYYQGGSNGNGITINLAGTFNEEGMRRSAWATMAHEVTHWLEGNSPEAYRALRSFVLQGQRNQGMNLEGRLQAIMESYRTEGVDLDMLDAVSELVAKSSEEVLTNEKMIRQLQAQNPEAYGKVRQVVNTLIDRVRTALGFAKTTSSIYAKSMRDYADQLAKVWLATYEEARDAKGTGEENGDQSKAQLSVIELTDGTRIAVEDENILDSKPEGIGTARFIYNYLTEHIGDKEIIDSTSDVVYLGKALPREYINSKYTKELQSGNKKKLALKNRTAGFIIDAIKTAYNKTGPFAAKHTNKNALYGVYKYNTKIAFPVKNQNGDIIDYNAYTAQMIVNHTGKNKLDLYDIIDIEKDTATGRKLKTESAGGLTKVIRHQSSAYTNNLTQKNNNGKSQKSIQESDAEYMQAVNSGDMETAQRMVDQAAEENGYTIKGWHGSDADERFTVFKPGHRGEMWFSSTKDTAYNKRKNMYETYLKMKNPYQETDYIGVDTEFDPVAVTEKGRNEKHDGAIVHFRLDPVLVNRNLDIIKKAFPDMKADDEFGNNFRFLPDAETRKALMKDGETLAEFMERGTKEDLYQWYTVYRPDQIKSADPVTYDDDGNVIPPSERFNVKKNDIRFSMREPVEVNKAGLIAVHNLGEEQLMQTLQLGGFPMPSIAIIRDNYAHNRYGDISVVFKPQTIDPKRSKANKVYGGDAWTATYQSIEYKINGKVLDKAIRKVEKLVPKGLKEGRVDLYADNLQKTINSSGGDIAKAVKNNLMLMAAYMEEQEGEINYPTREKRIANGFDNEQVLYVIDKIGMEELLNAYNGGYQYIDEHPELKEKIKNALNEQWKEGMKEKVGEEAYKKIAKLDMYKDMGFAKIDNLLQGVSIYKNRGINSEIDEHALKDQLTGKIDEKKYEAWLREQFDGIIEKKGIRNNKNYYTDSGNPRSWEALHDEETLENVVRVMKAELDKGSNAFFGQSAMLALGTRNFKSMDDIRAHRDQLQHISDEEMSAAKTNIVEKFGELMDEMYDRREHNIFIARDRALDAMVEAVRKSRKADGIMRELKQWHGLNIPADAGTRIEALVEEIANLPTEYFEAKPARAVGFDEIAKVIVPEGTSEELLDALDERGIPYEIYNGTDEGRLEALNRQEDAKFSKRDDSEGDIYYWMLSVKPETLQTEAERQLLTHFQDIETRLALHRKDVIETKDKIATLKAMGDNKDIKDRIAKLKVKQANAQRIVDESEAELAEIIGSEGYGKLMKDQQRKFEDFSYGKTSAEVAEEVLNLQKHSEKIAQMIDEDMKRVKEIESKGIIAQLKQVLGTTTADQTAAELKKEFHSTWTKGQIRNYLDPILLKLANGQDITSDVEELAGILIDSDERNTYEGLSALRGLTITLGAGAKAELKAQHSSLKDVQRRLAGTGIKVKYGERSTLETDIEDLRAEFPNMPEMGNEKDALENFVSWVEGMKQQSGGQEFYAERLAEAMAQIMTKVVSTAKGIYIPTEAKAQKQAMALIEYVKGLQAETEGAIKMLEQAAEEATKLMQSGGKATVKANVLTQHIGEALEYYDKTAKIAVAKAKQERNNHLLDQLKSKHAQDIAKRNDEWRKLIERDKNAREQVEQNRKYRNQINTVLKRAYNKLRAPKGLDNIPEYMQGLAREVIETFVANDLAGGVRFTEKTREDLLETMRVLDAWKQESGPFNIADLDEAEEAVAATINNDLMTIYDGLEQLNSRIRGKTRLDTLQQQGEILRQVQDAVSEIWSAIRTENTIQVNRRKVDVETQAWKIVEALTGKSHKEWTGKLGGIIRTMHKAIVSGNMTPEYFFRMLGNEGLSELWENYHEAENRNGLELKKAQQRLAEIAQKHGYANWDTKQKITLQLTSGAKVEMTVGQLMSLWATWKREMALGPDVSEHLAGGGFFAEQDTRDGLLGRKAMEKKAHRIAVDRNLETGEITGSRDMELVKALLTDEQLAFIDDVVGFMSNEMSALGNEASMAAYGIKMYKEGYYFPFQMWDGVRSRKSNDSGSAAGAQDRAFHPSFSKSRKHGANNALVIGDFMQTAADHIAGMINYATMGLANESLQKALNVQLKEDYTEDEINKRNVWTMMEEAYGAEAVSYLRELQKQLNGGAVKIDRTFYDKAISLFRKNAVAGSLSVAFQQPLSYIRAAMMISPKHLAAALGREYWNGAYDEMMAHSGVAVIKNMGRFDMNAGQSAREYLMPDGKESTARKVYDKVADYATILPEKMDAWTWTRMWVAVKHEQHALHPEMDVRSDEFLDLCGERFNDLMRRTQVYDSVLVRSANMRSQHPWTKSLTSFMAEPTLTLNVLADSVRSAMQGEAGGKALLAKAGATFALSAVMQSVIKALFSSGRSPDDKKTWLENFLYRLFGNMVQEGNPFSLIPGYSDMVTLLKKGELSDDAMGAVGKLITAGKGTIDVILGNGQKDWWRDIEDSFGQLAQIFTNVPVKNIMRDGRAMYNWITGENYADRPTDRNVIRNQTEQAMLNADSLVSAALTLGGYKLTNATYYKRIYEAKKAGNEAAAQSMIDYLINGKGVKEETINTKLIAQAKADESASAAETAEFMAQNGGNAEDYIRDQLREGNMTPEEARKQLKQADPEKDDNAIWWQVDRIEYQLETGAEKAPGGNSYYYRLSDAVDNNSVKEIRSAVNDLLKHGVDKQKILEKTSDWKKEYLQANSAGKVKIRNAIQQVYIAAGSTAAEADKKINKWK